MGQYIQPILVVLSIFFFLRKSPFSTQPPNLKWMGSLYSHLAQELTLDFLPSILLLLLRPEKRGRILLWNINVWFEHGAWQVLFGGIFRTAVRWVKGLWWKATSELKNDEDESYSTVARRYRQGSTTDYDTVFQRSGQCYSDLQEWRSTGFLQGVTFLSSWGFA